MEIDMQMRYRYEIRLLRALSQVGLNLKLRSPMTWISTWTPVQWPVRFVVGQRTIVLGLRLN